MPRAGIVTVVGKPNAGKSTLLNRVVGQKLSIVSPKPQSTRDRIVGIRTTGDVQIVLLDTPGLLNPRYPLQRAMRGAALAALAEADVVLYLVDGSEEPIVSLDAALNQRDDERQEQRERDGEAPAELPVVVRAPVVTVLNKVDLLSDARRDALAREHPEATLVSAATGAGVDALLERIGARLPESPLLYPDDEISTQTVRFFVAEFIRETALEQLDDEVPYSVACEIEEFREGRSPLYIRAVLHVERESQKQIVIGTGGARIRAIGTAARRKIETFVDGAVYLDLRVKVLANWRRNGRALARLGFKLPQDGSSR
jgi:GTP-binding protein Era